MLMLATRTKRSTQLLTHPDLDLQRYAGLWHEYARLPNGYQAGCTGAVTAEYTYMEDDNLRVSFTCTNPECEILRAEGELRPSDPADPAKLEIRFSSDWLSAPSSVWREHWVVYVDPNYEHAMIGTSDRRCLWMLGRNAVPDRGALEAMLRYAAQLGFSVRHVLRTGETG